MATNLVDSQPKPVVNAWKWALGAVGIGLILLAVLFLRYFGLGFFGPPDMSLLTGQPCPPPCWYGIVPGETRREDALRLLRANSHVAPQSIHELLSGPGERIIVWFDAKGDQLDKIYSMDDTVQFIKVEPAFDLTLDEIIGRYGDPTKIQLYAADYGTHLSGYYAQLYYPAQGLSMLLKPRPLDALITPIRPDYAVGAVYYLPSGSLDDIPRLPKQLTSVIELPDLNRYPLQDWNGFGDYVVAVRK